jgi:hypothetical protein
VGPAGAVVVVVGGGVVDGLVDGGADEEDPVDGGADEAEEPGEREVLLGDAVLDAVPLDVALLLVCEAVKK